MYNTKVNIISYNEMEVVAMFVYIILCYTAVNETPCFMKCSSEYFGNFPYISSRIVLPCSKSNSAVVSFLYSEQFHLPCPKHLERNSFHS
jgi:hypothetical protein